MKISESGCVDCHVYFIYSCFGDRHMNIYSRSKKTKAKKPVESKTQSSLKLVQNLQFDDDDLLIINDTLLSPT